MKQANVAKAKDSEVLLQDGEQAAGGNIYDGKKLTVEEWKAQGVELTIDPELENLLGEQPLSEESLENLTHSLLHDPGGCRDPIRVRHGCIADGHNRFRICDKHNLPFRIEEIEADTVDDLKVWMYKNQLGRRNLSKVQRACLVVWKHEVMAAKQAQEAKKHQKAGKVLPKSAKPVDVREELAKMAGVGHDMISKLLLLKEKAPERMKDVYEGKVSVNKAFHQVTQKTKGKPVKKVKLYSTAKKEICGYHGESLVCPRCVDEFMASQEEAG